MIQNLFRSCLICTITLITSGISAEVLKSSEFEDKDIPFLLNWKGEKQVEKNQKIDSNWWRWVQEDKDKTITEEIIHKPADEIGRALVYKRSIQPFRPNIDPLRSLITDEVRYEYPNRKRWISTSFGFGNRKKSGKQPRADAQKTVHVYRTPLPKIVQEVKNDYPKDRMNAVSREFYIHGENLLNSTFGMRGMAGSLGQSVDISDQPGSLNPTQTVREIASDYNDSEDRSMDLMNSRFHNYLPHQLPKDQERDVQLKTLPLQHHISAGKISVDPKLWGRYTTETIFERVFQPFTELRLNPSKLKLYRTTREPTVNAATDSGTILSQFAASLRSDRSESKQVNEPSFNRIADYENGTEVFGATDKIATRTESDRNADDAFNQFSVRSRGDSVKQRLMENKKMKSHYNKHDMKNGRNKHRKVGSNVAPPPRTRNELKKKHVPDEGAEDEMPPEEQDTYENNPKSLLPARFQPKTNKNPTRKIPASAVNSVTDTGKCGAGGSCGNCGGGINISIMMPNAPAALGPTAEKCPMQYCQTTCGTDKNKRRKDRNKKTQKSSENSLSELVIAEKKHVGNGNFENIVSIYRCKNESVTFSNDFDPSSEQQNINTVGGGSPKTKHRGAITSASSDIFGRAKQDRVPLDLPNNNLNYLNIVHQVTHPEILTIPTVYDMKTVGRPAEELDDEDELKELYDDQTDASNTEESMKFKTTPNPDYSKSTLPDNARNFIFGRNSLNNAAERFSVLEKLKNSNPGTKLWGHDRNIKYPSLIKKNKVSYPRANSNFNNLHGPREKSLLPKQRDSEREYDNDEFNRDDLYPEVKSKTNHKQQSRAQSYEKQRKHDYLQPNDDGQNSDYYDQWEALDADLKNDLTGGGQQDLRIQLKNRKREIDSEESADDAQGFYRLSSGSLRNPSSMVLSVLRRGRIERDKKLLMEEENADENVTERANNGD